MIAIIIGSPFSGKTTLLKKLQEKGIKVFHADSYITEIYKPGQIGYETIKRELGDEFVTELGVDKNAIRSKIKEDDNFLMRLNEIIHPLIKSRLEGKSDYVAELPIITSSPVKFDYDKTILVKASPEVIKARMIEKNSINNPKFIDYIISKWDNNIESDMVIDTSDDITDEQVDNLIKELNL